MSNRRLDLLTCSYRQNARIRQEAAGGTHRDRITGECVVAMQVGTTTCCHRSRSLRAHSSLHSVARRSERKWGSALACGWLRLLLTIDGRWRALLRARQSIEVSIPSTLRLELDAHGSSDLDPLYRLRASAENASPFESRLLGTKSVALHHQLPALGHRRLT